VVESWIAGEKATILPKRTMWRRKRDVRFRRKGTLKEFESQIGLDGFDFPGGKYLCGL
jgi:hypothetical protein